MATRLRAGAAGAMGLTAVAYGFAAANGACDSYLGLLLVPISASYNPVLGHREPDRIGDLLLEGQ